MKVKATEKQLNQLRSTGLRISEYCEFDVAQLDHITFAFSRKIGKQSPDSWVDSRLWGKPETIRFYLTAAGDVVMSERELGHHTEDYIELDAAVGITNPVVDAETAVAELLNDDMAELSDARYLELRDHPRTPEEAGVSKRAMYDYLYESYEDYAESCNRNMEDAPSFDEYIKNPFA